MEHSLYARQYADTLHRWNNRAQEEFSNGSTYLSYMPGTWTQVCLILNPISPASFYLPTKKHELRYPSPLLALLYNHTDLFMLFWVQSL